MAAYVFWERDEAAKMLADIMGVSRAATDSKALLAKAAAERSHAAKAEVEELAATEPVIGASGCFGHKVQMAFGRGDAGSCRTHEARAEAFDAAVADGYALLAAATGGDSGGDSGDAGGDSGGGARSK